VNPPAILFDVDGTLVDNSYLHTLAWARAFRDQGEEVAMAEIHRRIGMGSGQLVSDLLGREEPGLSDGHSRHIGELEADMRAFPRAADLLAEVGRRGAQVLLATSAKAGEVDARIELIGAGDAVDHVVHSGDTDASKPEPDIFAAALDKAGVGPDRALVVGDSVWDVEAAARCGLRTVGLTSGGISAAELIEAGAVAVYDDPADLLDRLDDSPLAGLLG
jgi:HAD superfamily hydrolase (TIGR01549 family)